MSREVRLSDRVKQLSFDPSTNAFSLDSVATGFSPFRDFYENGDVVFYAATDGTRYEVGSGEYRSNTLTRYPLRSNNISSGPYFVDGASSYGGTAGKQGHFYPLYLTKSAASGIKGFAGTASAVHEHRFSGYPGVTFYMPNTHAGHAVPSYHAGVSGQNYAVSGGPIDFQGVTEVFVTYPGKTSVFTGAGISGFNDSEPKKAGIAFWGNEQTLDYDSDIIWSTGENAIGVSQPSPSFAIDIGGLTSYSQIRSSGFIGGGSGVQFSGGQALPQSALKTASGGRQLEPFFRSELDTQTYTDQVFSLSGLVDQRLLFKKQLKGQIFAGPASGCDESSATCPQDHPIFRYLQLEDIPDLSSLYVVQQNYVDYGTDIPAGAVAFTTASGKVEYDKHFRFTKANNFLGVNIPIDPSYALDVGGNAGISGMLMVSGDAHFGGDIHAVGNLLVSGTKTFIDSTTVTVKDINLELGSLSGNPITATATNDAAIDDAGLIIKSKNYDKKWTWRNATDAWTTTERVDVSGIIFLGDDSVISGAYKPGSGIAIHNVGNGHRIDIGNIFHVSGTDQNTGFLHQNSVLVVSGVSGINTTYTPLQEANQVPSGRLTINPSFLYNAVFDKVDASGNKVSGVLTAADTYLTQRIDASGNKVSGIVSATDTYLSARIIASGNSAIAVASGWTNSVSGYVDAKVGSIGGGYGQWKVSASGGGSYTTHRSQNISSNNSVHFMGLSGVVADYSDTTKEFRFAAPGLSGDIMQHITNSGNRSIADASGWTNSVSGYFDARIGGLGGGYGHWKVSASGGANNSTHISDQVATTNSVHFMGLSGLVADYTASSNIFRFAAPGLSGDIMNHISNSGNKISGVLSATDTYLTQRIDASGNALSGIISGDLGTRIIASGNSAINVASGAIVQLNTKVDAITPRTPGSGLVVQDSVIDLSPLGTGTLNHLRFDGSIRIGEGAGVGSANLDGVRGGIPTASGHGVTIMGYEAASGQSNAFITSGTFIGYRAGYRASGQQNSVFIGLQAGFDAQGSGNGAGNQVENNIGIGKNAGRASINVTENTVIGTNAGLNSSGIDRLVAIGQGAANFLRGREDVIAIGYGAGSSSSGLYRNTIVGTLAGSGMLDMPNLTAIGYRAGASSRNTVSTHAIHNNFIGYAAGAETWSCGMSDFIGFEAGVASSGTQQNIALGMYSSKNSIANLGNTNVGRYAGAFSSGISYSEHFGSQAAQLASGNTQCMSIGYRAGESMHGAQITNAIGRVAGLQSYGHYGSDLIGHMVGYKGVKIDRCVGLGFDALKYSDNPEKSIGIGYLALAGTASTPVSNHSRAIAIGSSAGHKASGVSDSIFIGRNCMNYMSDVPAQTIQSTIAMGRAVGKGGTDRRLGSYNLIIEPDVSSNSRHAMWATDYADYIVSIGSIIHGYSSAMNADDNSSVRNLCIGVQPTSTAELFAATLTIKPDRASDEVLKLNRAVGQASDMLNVQTEIAGLSFSLSGRSDQTIIYPEGYLRIPTARYYSGGNFYDETGNKLPKKVGVFAIYQPVAGQTLYGSNYFIVCIDKGSGPVWQRQTAGVVNM